MPELTPVTQTQVTNAVAAIGQAVAAPKIMLMGDSGTGKTTALKTLIAAGITPFCIATEQNFEQIMKDVLGTKAHFKYIAGQEANSMQTVIDMLKKINQLSYENLSKVADPFKMAHNRFIDIMSACNQFVCDCCGKNWGNVASWSTDRAIVIDSLSGMSDMAFALVVGNKPVRALPDYQVAQNAIRMVENILVNVKCTHILITHLSREKDEVTGGTTVTAFTVGQKLGPDLPRSFSDVIRAKRNGAAFVWDLADTQGVTVGRHLPLKSDQAPSFLPLIQDWIKKGGKIEVTT